MLFDSLYGVELCSSLHKLNIHFLIKRIFVFIYGYYLLFCILESLESYS